MESAKSGESSIVVDSAYDSRPYVRGLPAKRSLQSRLEVQQLEVIDTDKNQLFFDGKF